MSFGAFGAAKLEPKDIEIPNLPSDSTSQLAWSPAADFLAVASWSGQVRLYQVNEQGQAAGKAEYTHDGPTLSVVWSKDGTKVLSGGADKTAKLYDVNTGQSNQVASHDAPVKCVRWVDQGTGLLATGSWDKSIRYWDLRSPNMAGKIDLPERCYSMDINGPLLVAATAERKLAIVNLASPTTIFKLADSPLRWQTRVVTCFPDSSGYALGTVEGRVAIQYVDEKAASSNFTFKCHRKDTPGQAARSQVCAVNDISFHPYGTFSTCGSDGTINFWDKESKTRLKTFDARGGPIASTGFNYTGRIFAYAVTQDWSTGHQGNKPDFINQVMLHPCKEEEVKKRAKK